jgi:hypothetical protein
MTSRSIALVSALALTSALLLAGEPHPIAIPAPRPVSLKFDKATAAQALAELTRQSGNYVVNGVESPSAQFSLELPSTTFWPALDAIARKKHSRVELYPRDGRLALVRQSAGYVEPPISYSGLFRTSLTRITTSRDLETNATSCSARLEVAWEPSLEPLLLESSPHGVVVRDDRGALLPTQAEGSVMVPVDGRLALAIDLPLPAVPRSTMRYSQLQGKMTAIAPSKMLNFAFDGLDRLAEVSADSPLRRSEQDGVSCRLTKIKLVPDRWTIQVTVDYPARGLTLESHQSRVGKNEMILESKDGSKRLSEVGYVIESESERRSIISYHFLDTDKGARGPAGNWKVRFRTPASLVEVPFTFAFKDVALP